MVKRPLADLTLLALLSFLLVGVLAAVFGDTVLLPFGSYVPTESTMGIVQRIFYFHLPAALTSFLAFFVAFVASLGYLARRRLVWDRVASASVEIGVLFCTMVLVTGPLWARPVWGAWWPWEPRLTTTLLLWLLYLSYLLLRGFTESREQRARFSAVLGVLAFLDVPVVYFSVRWWRGVHPVVFGPGGGGIEPRMRHVLFVATLAFALLYVILLAMRVRLAALEDDVTALRAGAAEAAA